MYFFNLKIWYKIPYKILILKIVEKNSEQLEKFEFNKKLGQNQ